MLLGIHSAEDILSKLDAKDMFITIKINNILKYKQAKYILFLF